MDDNEVSERESGDIVTSEGHNFDNIEEISDYVDEDVKDLDQAAWDFRQRYYGPDNNPVPPAAMAELAPEVMRLVDSVIYGEIYNRPAVDLKTRSLCTIAALVVLGHSPMMIKRHISGALHIGVTREEISEIIAQMVFYGGMPAAVNAFRMAKEAFDEPSSSLDPGDNSTAPGNSVQYRDENTAYGAAPPVPKDAAEESGVDVEPESRVRAVEQPPMTAERQPRRPSDMSRRERDEIGFYRDRQHGESHGRQSDQSRSSTNRPRPPSRGRNQPSGDGSRLGGQSKGSRSGQRGSVHVPPGAKGRGSSGPGRKRNPGRGK